MSTVFVRDNFPDIFTSLLAAIDTVYKQVDIGRNKVDYKKIFAIKKSKRQFENVTGFGGFGQFGTVGETENVPLMSAPQLYDKKFTHSKWAGAWQVSEEMQDDDQYEFVSSLARAFKRSAEFTKEVNLANVLNNGFTAATEPAADGLAIWDTHVLYNGNSITNEVTTDFGIAAAQAMFNHFANLTDDQGLRLGLTPKYIVANPAMRWVIGEIMRSQYYPTTSSSVEQNRINVLAEETLEEIYWPELTDTDAWYVFVAPKDVDNNCLRVYDRMPFTTSNDFDIKNLTALSVGRMRWSRGCIDWRGTYASDGSAS